MTKMKSTKLGWLGPAIVILGIVVAAFATWFVIRSKPEAGGVIDTIKIGGTRSFVIRAETGGDRNFVELRDGERVVWQAMVPTYGGRAGAPGIAWSDMTVSVRVIRSEHAEVFALAMRDGTKLGGFGLAPDHGAVTKQASGPVTLTDHVRAYEIVTGVGWSQLVAWDLKSGEPRWKQDLDGALIEAGGIDGETVWLRQNGQIRRFRASDGTSAL